MRPAERERTASMEQSWLGNVACEHVAQSKMDRSVSIPLLRHL